MSDLHQRLQRLDQLEAPDLWGRIKSHQPRGMPPDHKEPKSSRFLLIAAALILSFASLGFAAWALLPRSSPPASRPDSPAHRGLILFDTQASEDPNPMIAVTAPGSRVVTRLAAGTAPTWSPDGSEVAFSCGEHRAVCVMSPQGQDVEQLTKPPANAVDEDPSWGLSAIAFTRGYQEEDRGRDIYTVRRDGSGLRKLTGDDSDDYQPAWSPDGSRIAFVSKALPSSRQPGQPPGADDIEQIWVMDPAEGRAVRLTDQPDGASGPSWSPDGTKIAFDSGGSIYVMTADGTEIRKLTPAGDGFGPAWSPDGTKIIYTCGGDPPHEICVTNLDGTGRKVLLSTPGNDSNPHWGPG